MKKLIVTILALALLPASWALAQDGNGRKHSRNREEGGSNSGGGRHETAAPREEKQIEPEEKPVKLQAKERKQHSVRVKSQSPAVSGGDEGGVNHNPKIRETNQTVRHGAANQENGRVISNRDNVMPSGNDSNGIRGEKVRTNGNVHSNVSAENRARPQEVPAKYKKMGITQLPSPINDHNRILRTDRQHSALIVPKSGPGGAVIKGSVFSGKNISGSVVKTHMNVITNVKFMSQINIYNKSEMVKGNYYWHNAHGYNYCHYYDPWGYHWYGWYVGTHYFWTRWYADNWWWYDNSYDRWCYWHAGGWWWQDPARVNIVYVYHNNNYTPVDNVNNSTSNDGSVQMVFQSNDGTRKVKVLGEGRDGFLFDTSGSYSFEPVFLASGVKDVKFSDTSRGQQLQIILTLSDGTFRMYDDNGSSYNAR